MAHAADKIAFAPGGRVTVPFKPRKADRWAVGGVAPTALPAGRLSGKAIREGGARLRAWHRAAKPSAARRARRSAQSTAARTSSACGPRGRGRSGRTQARGLRLPAVLGADRQLDPARLGEALDHRLLRGRRGRRRHPPEDEQRRLDDGRLERLDELEDDQRHQRRPCQRRPGRADRPELRLVLGGRDPPEGAARQLGASRQPRPPDRGGRPRPRRRRRQPRLRADRLDLRRRVHRAGPLGPGRAQQGLARLPADVRHDRLDRQLPDRGRDRIGRRRRGRDHGLRLQERLVEPGRLGRAARRRRATTSATRSRPTSSRVPASKVILGVPYYGRAWSTATSALRTPRTSRAPSTARRRPSSTAPPVSTRPTTAGSRTRSRAWPGRPTGARTARPPTAASTPWREIYYDDAKALGLKYDLVNRYNLRGAGIWALGYDGTRTELYAVLKAKFITDTVPPVISAAVDQLAVLLAQRRRAAGHGHGPADRHRPHPVRLGRPAADRRRRSGRRSAPGASSARPSPTPGTARPPPARRPRTAPYRITVWTADASNNRASVSKVVTVDRRAAGLDPRRVVELHLARRRRPRRPDDALVERRTSGSAARPACSTRDNATVRRWTIAGATAGSWVWNGKNTAGADRRRTAATRSGWSASTAPGTRPSRDLQVRVDRTIRSLAWARSSFTPRAGPEGPLHARPAAQGDGHRRHLPGFDPGPPDLDGPCPGGRHVRLDVERQDGRRRVRQARELQGRRRRDQQHRAVPHRPQRHRPGAVARPLD